MVLMAAAASYGHAAAAASNSLMVAPLSKPWILGAFPSLSLLDLLYKIPTPPPPHHNFYDFPLQFCRLHRHRHRHHHHHNYSASCRAKPAFTTGSTSSSLATTADVNEVGDDGGGSRSSSLTTEISSMWVEFAKNVSGEWDGYEAEFSKEGKPMELPESVLPEAYREWEVKVFDWQTQCPTLARPRPDPDECLFLYKSVRLLPTVGCEADAATRYSVDERTIGLGLGSGCAADYRSTHFYCAAFAYQSTGCYVAVWVKKELEENRLLLMELEHCLIDPRNRESRVRIVQRARLDRSTDKKKLVLQNLKVCCEQWYGPFRNGEQLGGCAIRDSAFASTDALKASQLNGVWQGPHAVASFHNSPTNTIRQELVDDRVRKTVRDENSLINNKNLILLPKQLWCWLEESEDGEETWCEVGWLLDHGRTAMTSKCIFSADGNGTQLKEISMARETAIVEEEHQQVEVQ